jgi:hypothetical protein
VGGAGDDVVAQALRFAHAAAEALWRAGGSEAATASRILRYESRNGDGRSQGVAR